jgi:hypothetical protein
MIIKILTLGILIEALTELFFKAAPLQGIRQGLIKKTPFLNTRDYGHLLECKYCTSFWIALGVVLLSFFDDYDVIIFIACVIIGARLSNYIHVVYGIIKDSQMNMRLKRK